MLQKTVFTIEKMDCPSEEQLIRMKLAGISGIHFMDFAIPERLFTVFHEGDVSEIHQCLDTLSLGTTLLESKCVDYLDVPLSSSNEVERRLLWQVLGINFFFFLLEILAGYYAESMGLVGDSLDMLADSFVYGLALFAVGGSIVIKKNIARIAGYFQILLALFGLVEVIRRFIQVDSEPAYQTMITISIFALIGNGLCLYLLQKSKSQEAHMRASMIFTSNDILVNIGVIIAACLVYVTKSPLPDLIVGIGIFGLVGRGALSILRLGK